MKQTVSLPTLVHAYRPESLGVASRISSTSCSISVRLLVPRELPSLVQVMVPVAGRGQLSLSTSPGCTEHTVGFEIWYLFGASAERVGWGWGGGVEGEDSRRKRVHKKEKEERREVGEEETSHSVRNTNTT